MAMTDSVIQKLIENEWGCQWIGPEQDPRDGPVTYCGCKVIPGKAYCPEHYDKKGCCKNTTPRLLTNGITDAIL